MFWKCSIQKSLLTIPLMKTAPLNNLITLKPILREKIHYPSGNKASLMNNFS